MYMLFYDSRIVHLYVCACVCVYLYTTMNTISTWLPSLFLLRQPIWVFYCKTRVTAKQYALQHM